MQKKTKIATKLFATMGHAIVCHFYLRQFFTNVTKCTVLKHSNNETKYLLRDNRAGKKKKM